MALKQSINLDCKSKDGIIGISKKPAALDRWFLTIYDMVSVASKFKDFAGYQDSNERIGTHKEGGEPEYSETSRTSRS
jgi:hypothetical protein